MCFCKTVKILTAHFLDFLASEIALCQCYLSFA